MLAAGILLSGNFLFAQDQNTIMQAMRDELQRSMTQLSLGSLQKPYYIEYKLDLRNSQDIKASLGSLLSSEKQPYATLSVQIRVGSEKFDNTNFFDVGLGFFGSTDDEEGFSNRRIPFEVDYASLRRELWLATDAAYKQAVEIFAKKEASLKNRLRTDTTWDFKLLPGAKLSDEMTIPSFDQQYFEQAASEISGVFRDYPQISNSQVGIEYLPVKSYYVNSEGREYSKTELFTGLELVAYTQASDGMPLGNFYSTYSRDPKDLPAKDSLLRAARNVAETLKNSLNTSTLPEAYSGPVLFEGQAAAEIFAQVFAPNLVTQRAPLSERGFRDSERFTAFQNKIGGRVLPEFLSVKALPREEKFSSIPLVGTTKIDDDGIESQNVNLVENGFLKNLLSSRVPTRRVRESNGHERGGAAMLSNIELSAQDEKKFSSAELREKMMKMVKDRELPYGVIVRKVLDQNILYTSLYRMSAGDYPYSATEAKIPLLEVYKIFPDGREELVRGVEGAGFSVQAFKDIMAVGKNSYVMNYLAPAVSSPFITRGSQYVASSVIVPDLLFEDGEIRPLESDFPKPPILPSPGISSK